MALIQFLDDHPRLNKAALVACFLLVAYIEANP